MFGYVTINRSELKIKDYEKYHSYYCGLCRTLRNDYGIRGQMALTYDMTFLTILLTGLYEPETIVSGCRCMAHPFQKQTARINEYTRYAAAMNLILAYYKCEDDWRDENKILKRAYARLLRGNLNGMGMAEQRKRERIEGILREINRCEGQETVDIDQVAGLTGEMVREVFVCRQDEWAEELGQMGFYLGKFIYLCDAYEDVEKDSRRGNFNLLKEMYGEENFDARCREMLTMMMAGCCREFEKLPILENVDILRNILYSGVWCRFEQTRKKRQTQ